MRIGLLGGTFDPPHVGHLLAASDAYEALGLTRLLFVPTGRQPFKDAEVVASADQRLTMLRLMLGADPRFKIERAEISRPGLSYTVETLDEVSRRERQATLVLLIGEDLAEQFATWRDPERIAALADVVVMRRPGAPAGAADDRWPLRRIETRLVDVSSTEIRARVAEGKPIRGFVTDAVAEYIESARLYR